LVRFRLVRLAELVGTLSLATDASTGTPEEAGLRTAIVSAKLAALIGASAREQADAFWLAQLRYTGCTADADMAASLFGDEVEFGRETAGMDYGNPREIVPEVMRRVRKGKNPILGVFAMASTFAKMMQMGSVMRAHCEVADLMAASLGFDDALRAALVQHPERWDGSGPRKVEGDAIALTMRIAHVASDIEIGHRLGGREGAIARTTMLRGKSLSPAIVDRFQAGPDIVFDAMEGPSIWSAFLAAEPKPQREVGDQAIDEALVAMASFTDLKSKYTRGHSNAVSELAAKAAERAKLPASVVRDVRRAGLLHDLGRAAISASIWDKTVPLTDLEREKIRIHTYIGERVLARAPGLAAVAELACLAHERLDASGYHRRLNATSCPPAARILAAADVYCALVEERPHRPAFAADAAAAELRKMAESGQLCPNAARAILEAAGHVMKSKRARVESVAGLTSREVEVLRLLASGLTNKEIASKLDISTKTAGHHVQHIFEKLGVTTRAAAAICAMQKGIAGS
jgi:HD-GYP domain-containing protein (c-di-GMP phosphodiesterase class II)